MLIHRPPIFVASRAIPSTTLALLLTVVTTAFGQTTGDTEACCGPFSIGCADIVPAKCDLVGGISLGPGSQCAVDDPCFLQGGLACCIDNKCVNNVPLFFCHNEGGEPQEPGVLCGDLECGSNIQACCLDPMADLNCGDTEPEFCLEIGGTPAGDGTSCHMDDPCDVAPRPCCFDDGSCIDFIPPAHCEHDGGTPQPTGSTCEDAQCVEAPEACCGPFAVGCADFAPSECKLIGGEPVGPGSECHVDDPCFFDNPPACCSGDVCNEHVPPFFCQYKGGVPQEPGVACADIECGSNDQACCLMGSIGIFCNDLPPDDCLDFLGTPAGPNTSCAVDDPCDITPRGCCLPIGVCVLEPPARCVVQGGVPEEIGVGCDGIVCPVLTEACCFGGAGVPCQDRLPGQCILDGGESAGPDTRCSVDDPCDGDRRACCQDEFCFFVTPGVCKFDGGVVQPAGTTCDDVQCGEPTEACCINLPAAHPCEDLPRNDCFAMGYTPLGPGTSCMDDVQTCLKMELTEACCFDPQGALGCADLSADFCLEVQGEPAGLGTSCSVGDPCDFAPRACCIPDGTCQFLDPQTCVEFAGGVPQESGSTCDDVACGQAPEACCISPLAALFCVNVPPSMCPDFMGRSAGPGTECFTDDPCDFFPRACCLPDGGCLFLDPQSCAEGAGGVPRESGVTCDVAECLAQSPEIVHLDSAEHGTFPCSGFIDPRQESTNGLDIDLGITSASILFNRRVFGSPDGTKLTPANFIMTETGGGDPPIALGVFPTDDIPERVIVLWDRPITPGEWTTIVADVYSKQGFPIKSVGHLGPGVDEPDRIDVAFLPGDIDQNGLVSPVDLFVFRRIANGLCATNDCPSCDGQLAMTDIDRDGELSPLDLFRYRQLINGLGNATQAWGGQFLTNSQP